MKKENIMRKVIVGISVACLLPAASFAQRIQQASGRAVVAVTDASGGDVLVSWRRLAQEPEDCTYNIYVRQSGSEDYTKLNDSPLASTSYETTTTAVPYGSEIAVSVISGGTEGEPSAPFTFTSHDYGSVFFEFDFEGSVLSDDDYTTNYAWPMDTDGDGEHDALLVTRLFNGDMLDGTDKLQAYTFDGECLWTADAGPNVNICTGQADLVTVYDIDCDGQCEVLMKSSDGTRFWDSTTGDWGLYACGGTDADTDGDGIVDYRTETDTANPPFYISVLNARTGEEKAYAELDYDEATDGDDQYSRGNRADYMTDSYGTEYAFMTGHFAICYFDGIHPSLAMECLDRTTDGTHHEYIFAWGYDWSGGQPTNWSHYYTWSRNDKEPYPAEFHQMRVADTDGDGIDDLIPGGFGVNTTSGMVFSADIEHGDRFDVADIDPERPGMEVFAIQQSSLMGQVLYDAATGEHIKEWYMSSITDVGRGRAIDVDSTHKGYEIFSTLDNLYDCHGDIIAEGETTYPTEAIWWDGDLQRELISSPGGSGNGTNVNISKYSGTRLIEISKESGWTVHATSGVRPAFMGDIIGDWREEIILPKQTSETSTGMIGYSTTYPTDYSFYYLQEDPHYRLDCTTRGYYQMPCTSFYLGGDMPAPPLPPTLTADLRYVSGGSFTASGTFSSFDQTTSETFAAGKSVIFDISGDTAAITLAKSTAPSAVYLMNPAGHNYAFNGGSLAGDMTLYKSMQGTATFNSDFAFSGTTLISEGTLAVNGTIAGDVDLRARGTLSGDVTVCGTVTFEGGLNYEGCRLMPAGKDGVMTFNGDLTLPGDVYIEVTLSGSDCGRVAVDGALTLSGTNTITVAADSIDEGEYVVMTCAGALTANADSIKTRGLTGYNYDIVIGDSTVTLVVNGTREAADSVVWTGAESNVWDYKTANWAIDGEATTFVSGDKVFFNDDGLNRDITVDELMITGGVTFEAENVSYTFTGEGGISGEGGMTKNGAGEVELNIDDSDYTGATVINDGTLTVSSLIDGGKASGIGAASADEGFFAINGGTLYVKGQGGSTDRILTLSDTSTVYVAESATVTLNGKVNGDGYMVKDGDGQLNFGYAGENPFAGMIIRGGTVSHSSYLSTFGAEGSPMVLEGGTVALVYNTSSSTRPVFNYETTVAEGTDNIIEGTYRGTIEGSFYGSGNLTIVSDGVRNDIGADFSEFSGTLTAQGENFRLQDNVTDMKLTSIIMDEGCKICHYNSNGSTTTAVNTDIGSLTSESSDCKIGNGIDSYDVGYLNADDTFRGILNAATVRKYGTGIWSLTSNESVSDVEVHEGTLQLRNSSFIAFTTGELTVCGGATVCGTGCMGTTTVQSGGTIRAGRDGGYGTLRGNDALTLEEGSTMVIKVGYDDGEETNDKFYSTGTTVHNGDTIIISVDVERTLETGDELTVFTGSGERTGTYVLITEAEGQALSWDDTRLLSDGVITVTDNTGIRDISADTTSDSSVNVYSVSGVLLRTNVKRGEALDGLNKGIYIIGGKKVMRM